MYVKRLGIISVSTDSLGVQLIASFYSNIISTRVSLSGEMTLFLTAIHDTQLLQLTSSPVEWSKQEFSQSHATSAPVQSKKWRR